VSNNIKVTVASILPMNHTPLLINLSFLLAEPTGISIYAQNVFPYLQSLAPTLLTSQTYQGFNCYPIPSHLTPAQGSRGHFERLVWTQTQLPSIYKKLGSTLLFSPLAEAPLGQGCRSVVMVHDLIPLRFPRWRSPLTYYCRFYLPAVAHQAEHILCNSQATADDLINFLGLPAAKITPILLGHDPSRFALPPPPPPPQPYFLYLGRPDPHKNLERLIRAIAPLAGEYELWLAGPQDHRYTPALMNLAASLGIATKVRCLNYVPAEHLTQLLQQALALVFPSLWEGFGFPVLEAMACGTAVITSRLSSLPEVTANAALLVNPYQVSELTAAMTAIATNASLRQELEVKGLARAQQLTWEKTGLATRELLAAYL